MEIGRLRPLGVDLSELSGRIKSMGRAHELLAIAQWSGVELRESIEIIVSPWAPEGEATIDGDNVRLSPEYAMPMCMMLNELVTNAVKHGALSVPTGTLRLAWTLKSGDLSLTWTEAGGPAIDGEPKSTGMGLNLIRGFVEHELGGSLTMNWLPEGLRVSMRFKLI
jgi:two-component sensor histidine kinase